MRLSHLAAVTVVLGGLTTTSFGADRIASAGGYTTAARLPALWSGFYLGLHGGYASARASGTTFDGGFGGLQIGYNAQFARNVILGVEADISGGDISRADSASLFGIAISATTRTYALGTFRGRAGFAFDQFMIYGTGGFAWAVNELTAGIGGVNASDTNAHTGYTFGAGLEWMITPAWTARAEYLYAHFGSEGYFGGTVASGDVDANIVRIAANYLIK